MRYFIFTLLLLTAGRVTAQQFTQLLNDPLTTQPGDSRSINIVDVNGDGFEDVYITNGLAGGQNNELYINQGNGSFTTVTNQPIVFDASPSDGATCADADNDGDIDCFMVTWYGEPNFYYRNDGNGQFTHLPNAATGTTGTHSETAAFGDYDNDGLVDLYITNSESDLRNMLYRNTGNHTYTKISAPWLEEAKPSRSANWSDYDNDGDQDLFVVNEGANTNSLFKNNGDGSFTAVTGSPVVQGNLGSITASWGDVNNDGFNDLFVGNTGFYLEKNNRLFLNNTNGGFTIAPSGPISTDGGCTYGSAFADYDNDGDLDLFVANGYCNGNIVNFLYKNDGAGAFERDLSALPTFSTLCSYGTAWGDLNNDGFQDLVVSTCKNKAADPQPNNLAFINNGNNNHWLKIALISTISNRSAIGAKVLLTATINGQTVTQKREISAQSGYCGQNSLIAHFGLGAAATIENVIVQWPSGIEQVFGNITPDQTLQIIEAQSSAVESPKKNDTFQLRIAPNPVGDALHWTFSTAVPIRKAQFEIIDLQGKLYVAKTENDLEAGNYPRNISLKGFTPGLYLLRMVSDEGMSVVKFVVE